MKMLYLCVELELFLGPDEHFHTVVLAESSLRLTPCMDIAAELEQK